MHIYKKSSFAKGFTAALCCAYTRGVYSSSSFVATSVESTPLGCHDEVDSKHWYMGCFADKKLDRALPHHVDGRFHSAKICQEECDSKGFKFSAREWKGLCFCGDNSNFSKHGAATDCDCCGSNVGENKMCVWSNSDTATADVPQAASGTPTKVPANVEYVFIFQLLHHLIFLVC